MGYFFYKGVLKINLAKFFRYTGIDPDRRGGRRAVVRRARPPGGRHPARPLQPRLRREQPGPAESSWYGTLLKGTVNFTPNTTWLQAVAWLLYLVPTMTVFVLRTRTHARPPPPRRHLRRRAPTETERPDPVNRLLTAACAAALLVPLSACSLTESNKPAAQGGQGTINVDSSADKCDLTTVEGPLGQRGLQGEEHRRRGHRVLPVRRGRHAHRRRDREHRPRPVA